MYIGREVVFRSLDLDSYYNLHRLLYKLPKLHSVQILEFHEDVPSSDPRLILPMSAWDRYRPSVHQFSNIKRLVMDALVTWPMVNFPNVEEITLIRSRYGYLGWCSVWDDQIMRSQYFPAVRRIVTVGSLELAMDRAAGKRLEESFAQVGL
jgi:hypothetical protein